MSRWRSGACLAGTAVLALVLAPLTLPVAAALPATALDPAAAFPGNARAAVSAGPAAAKHTDTDGVPDRHRDDGIPKPSKLRALADILPVDPTQLTFTPLAAPQPAVYGDTAITVLPQYGEGPGADGLETLPTCGVAQAVIDAGYPAGDHEAGAVCDGAVPKDGFTVVDQPVTGLLQIVKADLTVTASSADANYGTIPAIEPSFEGFQFSDTPASLAAQPTCTTTATPSSSPGPFISSCSGGASDNYTFTFVDGVVNILPAPLTITPSDGTATYGVIPAISPKFTGLVNGTASLTAQPTCSTSVTIATGAGVFTDTTSCSGAESPNYIISYGPMGITTINPANLTVTALGQSRLVGQPNKAFSANFSGFVNNETQSVLSGTLVFTTQATTASGPGSYPVTPSGLTSTNYAISFIPGTIVVTAVPPPSPTPTPTISPTPTVSPTPSPSPTRTSTPTPSPSPDPVPAGGGWPIWLTLLLVGFGGLIVTLIVVVAVAMTRRNGRHEA